MRTLTVTHSPSGKLLRRPLVLRVKDQESPAEKKLRQYIIDTFLCRQVDLAVFVYKHRSTMQVARHYLFHISGSPRSLLLTSYSIYRFCKWLNVSPDKYLKECFDRNGTVKPNAMTKVRSQIGDFISYLNSKNLSRSYIRSYIKSLNLFFSLNGAKLELPYTIRAFPTFSYRAPTLEELQKVIDIAGLREKVIISMLAVSGIRVGSLVKLQYRHVKDDLERNVIPICVPIEAFITKGHYRSYYTFLNQEATEYLRAYLDLRRRGTADVPREEIRDDSPLIRVMRTSRVAALNEYTLQYAVHHAYYKAGLIERKVEKGTNRLTTHSLRKFFQTEMAARGVNPDYIHFMMGHKTDLYSDIKMKGVDFLRGIYLTADLRIRPKVKLTKVEALKEIISSWGLNPEEILSRKVLDHRQIHSETEDS